MRRISTRERDRFIATIAEEVRKVTPDLLSGRPFLAEALARKILRWGTTYGRLAEEECNGPPGVEHMGSKRIARWQAGLEKRQAQAERMIASACFFLSRLANADGVLHFFAPIFQGDPRGSTVKLRVPSGRTDDVAQEGICVPTS